MRRRAWVVAGAAVLAAVTATAAVAAISGEEHGTAGGQEPPASTAAVEKGELAAMVSLNGTLTYRARPDGSPYPVVNQAGGIYTELPAEGAKVGCGDVLYRVDERPVLLLCGTVPAYRDLDSGDEGRDVRQLNRNLRALGYDAGAGAFTWRTEDALRALQADRGLEETGVLHREDAVVLPEAARIAKVTGVPGGSARPGAQVALATSDTLHVQVDLEASQQRDVRQGDRARITLPGNRSVAGRLDRLGRVAQAPEGRNADAAAATVPAFIGLDHPKRARGLDRAPVRVDVSTTGVKRALSVPVVALVGRSGGGFAVEAMRDGGRRELVAVRLGLFDSASGRVEVEGDLDGGDRVVVPSL